MTLSNCRPRGPAVFVSFAFVFGLAVPVVFGGGTGDAAPASLAPAAASDDTQIGDLRVVPASTSVEISFVGPELAALTIGTVAPQDVLGIQLIDPERQVAGYLFATRGNRRVIDTARDEPMEGSTNGPVALRPGTTYHFVISLPGREPGPDDDEDDVVVGEQCVGTFVTAK